MRHRKTGAAVLALSLLVAPLARAQAPAADAPAQAESAAPAPTRHARRAPAPHLADQVEQHIARLHSQLKITPAQSEKWELFAQVMRDNAKHMDGLYQQRAKNFATMNAIDSLKSYQDIADAHVEDLQKLQPAFAALYNSMDEKQQKVADRLFRNSESK